MDGVIYKVTITSKVSHDSKKTIIAKVMRNNCVLFVSLRLIWGKFPPNNIAKSTQILLGTVSTVVFISNVVGHI